MGPFFDEKPRHVCGIIVPRSRDREVMEIVGTCTRQIVGCEYLKLLLVAQLPRAGRRTGTSENWMTFTAARLVPDRGMMTQLGTQRFPKIRIAIYSA